MKRIGFTMVSAALAACGTGLETSAAAELPRLTGSGRVLVIDDFSQGLDAWDIEEVTDRVRIEPDAGRNGSGALVWNVDKVTRPITYKRLDEVKKLDRFNRMKLVMRASDQAGREGLSVAAGGYTVLGGLPWQLANRRPSWGHGGGPRPVFDGSWRIINHRTDYPVWYRWGDWDNTEPNLSLHGNSVFGRNATLVIDRVVLIDDPVEVLGKEYGGIWGEGRRLENGGYRYDYTVRLRNRTDQRQEILVDLHEKDLDRFHAGIEQPTLQLKPNETGALNAWSKFRNQLSRRCRIFTMKRFA